MTEDSKTKVITVEIETAESGSANNATRIISVQFGDSTSQEVYYADANEGRRSLFQVPIQIQTLLSQGYLFTGYGIKGLTMSSLQRFLSVTIPLGHVLDIKESDAIRRLEQKLNKAPIELGDACKEYGVLMEYERPILEKADQLNHDRGLQSQSKEEAQKLPSTSMSIEATSESVLSRLAKQRAVLGFYQEFLEKGGSADTPYHRYVTGRVVCEYQLLSALRRPPAALPAATAR